jgi:hypothetical protein
MLGGAETADDIETVSACFPAKKSATSCFSWPIQVLFSSTVLQRNEIDVCTR